MWNNIGVKIKNFAKISTWASILADVVLGIVLISLGAASDFGGGLLIGLGIGILLLATPLSWAASMVLYGFGELIEKTSNLEAIARGKTVTSTPGVSAQNTEAVQVSKNENTKAVCSSCFNPHPEGATICEYCFKNL